MELTPIVLAIIGSTGLWEFIKYVVGRRDRKKIDVGKVLKEIQSTNSKQNDMLVALGHDKIVWLGRQFLKEGYVDSRSYASIIAVFEAYTALGGNGEAKKIMTEVEKLPIK